MVFLIEVTKSDQKKISVLTDLKWPGWFFKLCKVRTPLIISNVTMLFAEQPLNRETLHCSFYLAEPHRRKETQKERGKMGR